MTILPRVSLRRRAKRLSLSAKKKLTPEKYCCHNRCYRRPRDLGRCGTHLTAHLDHLWSVAVRARGSCENCGAVENLQAAHGFSRRYRGTRWVLLNGFALCVKCHKTFTHDPIAWDVWLMNAWGNVVYHELRRVALAGEVDVSAALAALANAEGG